MWELQGRGWRVVNEWGSVSPDGGRGWSPRDSLWGWGWDEQEGLQPWGRAGGAPGWDLGLIPALESGWGGWRGGGSRPAGTGPAGLTA